MNLRFTLFFSTDPAQLRDVSHALHFDFGQIDVWKLEDIEDVSRFFALNSPAGYIPIVSSSADGAYAVFESAWLKAKATYPALVVDEPYATFVERSRALPAQSVLDAFRE